MHIVLDLEIEKTIEELPNGWDDTHLMGVSCCCVYRYDEDRYCVYGQESLEECRSLVANAERITTFNGLSFDLPVLFGESRDWRGSMRHCGPETTNLCDDLLRRIWRAAGLDPNVFVPETHGGFGLGDMCRATLGVAKIGTGASAPLWWRQGKHGLVVNYCLHDVWLTKRLGEFIGTYGYVIDPLRNEKLRISPDWRI